MSQSIRKKMAIHKNLRAACTWLFAALCLVAATSVAAHKYFFAITNMVNNAEAEQLEIIHQLTAHDIENTIADIHQVSFNPEHPQYETLIQQYVEAKFQLLSSNQLTKEKQLVPIQWIGIEVIRDKIFVYQQAPYQNFFGSLVVKNTLLVDTYAKQVNTLNYQSNGKSGSLTFDQSRRILTIE